MTFTRRDLEAVNEVLREAVRTAVMPRFRNLESDAVRMKTGPLDIVTEADEAAEAAIETALLARFPGCVVIGEEAASADPRLMTALPVADLAINAQRFGVIRYRELRFSEHVVSLGNHIETVGHSFLLPQVFLDFE